MKAWSNEALIMAGPRRAGLLFSIVLLMAGCAGTGPPRDSLQPGEETTCQGFYQALDRAVAEAGTGDAGATRMPGYPFLRVNRFLASFTDRLSDPGRYQAWVEALAGLDRQARRVEIANLPPLWRDPLKGRGDGDVTERLERCSRTMTVALLRDPGQHQGLLDAARVPDHYRTWQRVVGVYPVALLFAGPAIKDLHERLRRPFSIPREQLPTEGRLIRYRPGTVAPALQSMEIDRRLLGSAWREPAVLQGLFDRFAPVIEVDTRGDDDRIGRPEWREGGKLVVDTSQPMLYRYLSYTRFQGTVLLQLNYLFWFPARDTGDIYSGRFDGLIWRVTLTADDWLVAYDTIHGCGCYYQLFPGPGYQVLPDQPGEEPVLVPATAPELARDGRLLLRLNEGAHYLQGVYPEAGGLTSAVVRRYRLTDYRELLSMPLPGGGSRSLFGPDGLVSGSERLERFLLWPFGVPSPGAMRQPGTHAIAFVGRRHFDDPGLLESLMEPLSSRF